MMRVIRPKGFIAAVESKFGVHDIVDTQPDKLPHPAARAADMTPIFEELGLVQVELPDVPPHAYVCRNQEDLWAA
jgi:hypothetical protein